MSEPPLAALFMPESAYGPTNNCIGIGNVLRQRGHRVVFSMTHLPVWAPFDAWVQQQGAPPLPHLEFIHTSEHLNLCVYPEAIDYTDQRPLDANWRRLDSSVRQTGEAFELPPRSS